MTYVIIGNSAAGVACVEAIRSKDKKAKIAVISEEPYHIYSRCLLSYFLAGTIREEKLIYRGDDFYKAHGLEALVGVKCDAILPKEKSVRVEGGKKIKFDKLLVATGSRPNFPEIKGIDKDGVLGLRTIADAERIRKFLPRVKTVAILGGGLIGLKSAYGLSTHEKDIRVLVKSDQVLSQVLDKKAGAIFQNWIAERGVRVMTGVEAKEVAGKGRVEALSLDNGETLECEMVVVGKGVRPNVELAKEAGIKVAEGLVVNAFLETSIPDIYAAGDVAQAQDRIWGEPRMNALWPIAVEEGRVAGLNMAGERIAYEGSLGMNSVEFFGLPLIAMGVTRPREGLQELVYEEKGKDIYKKVVLKGNVVVGMIFVNDIKGAGVIGNLIKNKIDVSGVKDALLDERFDFAKVVGLIKENADKFGAEEFRDIALTY